MPTETINKLANITDAAQFERIATSVLRSANSDLYGNLSHQGVNTDGKTVKAPLDNIGWVNINGEAMCVAAAHTTAKREDLKGKWLHDSSTVTPRKAGKNPTQPSGDLVKALGEFAKMRIKQPNLRATLALTCNSEEPTEVRLAAEALAQSANVKLDIWSISRIAQYLDTTPAGQSIRYAYLGTQINHLSKDELLRVGVLSLKSRNSPTNDSTLVDRHKVFYGTGHVMLSGASGMGKTTICLEILRDTLADGHPGIVLNDQTVANATSIEEAIDIELRRYLPQLEHSAGATALDFCSELDPFVVVVEDINRSENTISLLNKLASWALHEGGGKSPKWRLLCPIWPRFLAGLEKSNEVNKVGMIHFLGVYSENDAQKAVKRRSLALGISQNDLAAAAIARSLGYDPLLIGLYDFVKNAEGNEVIAQYVNRELAAIALTADLTTTDLETAANALMSHMLMHRNLTPTWNDAITWFGNSETLKALRFIVLGGGVLRLNNGTGQEIIEARHDRILHFLLATFIATRIESDLQAPYLSDPFFAEFVGTAASIAKLDHAKLLTLMCSSPLTGFFAFKNAVIVGNDYTTCASLAIEEWANKASTKTPEYFTRRALGLQILSEIDSPLVIELTSKFTPYVQHQHLFEARFRNGDIAAGLNWLTKYPFDVSISGCKELIEHVHNKYGSGLLQTVVQVLENSSSSPRAKSGALFLAGYIGDPNLAKAVRTAWQQTKPEDHDLVAFLWAAARVCGTEAATTLGPVCDAWEVLPEPENDLAIELTRSNLAAHGISWKFRDHVPKAALPYFVKRATESDALMWPITYMFRGIDDPIAIHHVIEYLAERSRESVRTGGFLINFINDEWRRQTDNYGRKMSTESKQCLLDLAMRTENDSYLRKQAFSLWEINDSEGDLIVARSIEAGNPLHSIAVWARARRGDLSVIPELLQKIKENPRYWWQAGRYIWTDELTSTLAASLKSLGQVSDGKHEELGVWIFPELILRLDPVIAEKLLLEEWANLRTLRSFIQVALCLSTQQLVQLANKAISDAIEPKKLFVHFSSTAGLNISGRTGFSRISQLEAVRPHLSLFSLPDIFALWNVCNKRNWKQFRKEYLDPIILKLDPDFAKRHSINDSIDMKDLEDELSGTQQWPTRWMDNHLRNGVEGGELIAALLEWIQKKPIASALKIVGRIFSTYANRTDFARLQEVAIHIEDRENILEETKFEIFHRTLN